MSLQRPANHAISQRVKVHDTRTISLHIKQYITCKLAIDSFCGRDFDDNQKNFEHFFYMISYYCISPTSLCFPAYCH